MDKKYDFNKCSKEQMAEYLTVAFGSIKEPEYSERYYKTKKVILNTAEVKLRTRQEINNEIANIIRYQDWFSHGVVAELNKLCKEEHSG
jgi:hypothetical protein